MAIERVGFIGLGTMGKAMARNVLSGGFPLWVYDIDPTPVAELAEAGATACGSAAEVAANVDAVCSIVPDVPEVEEVILGESGIAAGARPAALIIEMSTIDPGVSASIAEKVTAQGLRMIDAPVCRSSEHAQRGELMVLVGGGESDYEEAMPLLRTMGNTFHHCGPNGTGLTMKLVNNMMGQAIGLAICEALTLGVKAGLDLSQLMQVITGTAASSKFLEQVYPESALAGDFRLGFALDLAHKDVGHALRMAARLGSPCPAAAMAHTFQNIARSHGKGRMDHTAMLTVFEELAGVRVRLNE